VAFSGTTEVPYWPIEDPYLPNLNRARLSCPVKCTRWRSTEIGFNRLCWTEPELLLASAQKICGLKSRLICRSKVKMVEQEEITQNVTDKDHFALFVRSLIFICRLEYLSSKSHRWTGRFPATDKANLWSHSSISHRFWWGNRPSVASPSMHRCHLARRASLTHSPTQQDAI